MTEPDRTRFSSGELKPQWLIDFEEASRRSGDEAREQLRADFGDDTAQGKEWPAPARGTSEVHLFDGAWVRLLHEPHSMTGRVRGLRRVADGGPFALLLDVGSRGLHAARPTDGSAWTTDIDADAILAEQPETEVTVWFGFEDSDVIPAATEDWQLEPWTMRTAPRLESL
ncbi:hypothetical protein ABTZ46_26650 [Nocardioides sp. NPDC126508]